MSLLAALGLALAGLFPVQDSPAPALKGLDPVELTRGKEVAGDAKFVVGSRHLHGKTDDLPRRRQALHHEHASRDERRVRPRHDVAVLTEIAQSHHEWWDGSGYPLGIQRTSIALAGRIVAVADVYDALCSKRPYKRAWPKTEAARFVISGRGGQFDPEIVDAFIAVFRARHPELAGDVG